MRKQTKRSTRTGPLPPPPETAHLQAALERFDFMEEHGPFDWPGQEDLRSLAEALGVPYLLLLLHFYSYCTPAVVTLDDINEWNAAPDAHRALTDWWARNRKAVA